MNKRVKTIIAATTTGLGLVLAGATPASAAPGAYEVELFNHGDSYKKIKFNCPPTGGARAIADVLTHAADAATEYRVNYSPCKLTIFEFDDGRGRGIGLQRDRQVHGLGVIAGNAESIASYGS